MQHAESKSIGKRRRTLARGGHRIDREPLIMTTTTMLANDASLFGDWERQIQ